MKEMVMRLSWYPISGTSLFWLFRDIGLPLIALLMIMFLPGEAVIYLFIIGGQAHFLMAYLYQYRGRRMNRVYLLTAIALLTAMLWYFMATLDFTTVYIAVSILFGIHFALDELTLHNEQWTLARGTTLIGFLALYTFLVLGIANATWYTYAALLGVVLVCGAGIRICSWDNPPSQTEWYLWFIEGLLLVLAFSISWIPLTSITTLVIVLHFFNWAVGYGAKLHGKPQARRYWIETVGTFTFCALLCVLYIVNPLFSILGIFFGLMNYYAWAIAHIMLSFVVSLQKGR